MLNPLPTPRQIFRQLDSGEISRERFRELMAEHTQLIIGEMVEAHQNPIAAWLETLRNRRAASRLASRHGEMLVREIFTALADLPEFPLANWLWNADQPHVPLHCFLRSRREPIFRVLKIASAPFLLTITVEYGNAEKDQISRERFIFTRDRFGRLHVKSRENIPWKSIGNN
jgi:hypothetical protein